MVAILSSETVESQKLPDRVREDYAHVRKVSVPQAQISLGTCRLKWYDIHFEGKPILDDITDAAVAALQAGHASGALEIDGEIGFVILHDCTSVVFLTVQTWRGNNEIWETVFLHEPGVRDGFRLQTIGAHKPCFCVWEMGAVWHETQAWARYLRSERSANDQAEYLSDQYAGFV